MEVSEKTSKSGFTINRGRKFTVLSEIFQCRGKEACRFFSSSDVKEILECRWLR